MKWKLRVLFLASLLSVLFFGFIITSGNVNATSVPNANIRRSYYHPSVGITNNESVGSQSIPYTILSYENGVVKRVYGISASTVPVDSSNERYKTLSVNFTITQDNYIDHNNNSLLDTPFHYLYITAGGQDYQVECSTFRWINDSQSGNSYTCVANFNNYENITAITVRAGIMNAENNTTPLGTTGCSSGALLCNLGSIYLDSFSYTITASADPLVQGQQTIINQNQTIINQNNQMFDYLNDSTPPSADTSVLSGSAGWLPPGPVDSILNLPIQLVQGIVGVFTNTNTCAPIQVPLGLIDYTLQIPCMRPFFELAGVNIVWNTVGSIISAFLVYNTLKWLYKFVDETLTFRENESTMWGGL